jgi:hypothetical protein
MDVEGSGWISFSEFAAVFVEEILAFSQQQNVENAPDFGQYQWQEPGTQLNLTQLNLIS